MKKTSYKLAACGVLSALACITFVIENLFPPLFIPGAKLGLSNLFILLALATLGARYAFFALGVKTLVGCFVTGFYSLAYSLPAGIAALAAEIILIYYVKTSLPAASAAGAVINVTVQNLVFCITAGAAEYFVYLPYLALIGAVTGSAVGLALHFAVGKLPENLFKENAN